MAELRRSGDAIPARALSNGAIVTATRGRTRPERDMFLERERSVLICRRKRATRESLLSIGASAALR